MESAGDRRPFARGGGRSELRDAGKEAEDTEICAIISLNSLQATATVRRARIRRFGDGKHAQLKIIDLHKQRPCAKHTHAIRTPTAYMPVHVHHRLGSDKPIKKQPPDNSPGPSHSEFRQNQPLDCGEMLARIYAFRFPHRDMNSLFCFDHRDIHSLHS